MNKMREREGTTNKYMGGGGLCYVEIKDENFDYNNDIDYKYRKKSWGEREQDCVYQGQHNREYHQE